MDWKPIETAKRGPAIVWSKSKGLIKDAMLYGNNGYAVHGSCYHAPVYDVTHWMPDPAPPEDRERPLMHLDPSDTRTHIIDESGDLVGLQDKSEKDRQP